MKSSDWKPLALQRFLQRCDADLAEVLAGFGFVVVENEANPAYAKRTFVSGSRYIRLSISFDPRDMPYECLVSLGEGSRQFPESDWNAVPLWRTHPEANAPSNTVSSTEDIDRVLDQILSQLRHHASGFLEGDLTLFYQLRARLNSVRDAYRVWKPDEAGKQQPSSDPESASLKERFSRAPTPPE